MSALFLNSSFSDLFSDSDPFDTLWAMEGEVHRDVKGRVTKQFTHQGQSYFVKLHSGVGWLEIIKNLLQLRLPILGARNEWQAVARLQELGIDTMTVVAYGEDGWNPARRRSFVVTEDLSNTRSLEDVCADWPRQGVGFSSKKALIEKLAKISRVLHQDGICHRDYYICHFLMDQSPEENQKVSLIYLHRALIKDNLSERWIIKDVSGLYFSAMDIGLTRRDLFRFMKVYSGQELRQCLKTDITFWRAVDKRARAMYKKLSGRA